MLNEISKYGIVTYKRIYGDWTKNDNSSWKAVLLENSITPIQQYSYTTGKNATDSAMIIDAMDILYTGQVEGFCLVSPYRPLASTDLKNWSDPPATARFSLRCNPPTRRLHRFSLPK